MNKKMFITQWVEQGCPSFSKFGRQYNLTKDAVRSRLRRICEPWNISPTDFRLLSSGDQWAYVHSMNATERLSTYTTNQAPLSTSGRIIADGYSDDERRYKEILKRYARDLRNQHATGLFFTDVHLPDQDDSAIELALQIGDYLSNTGNGLQFVSGGSDVFDLPHMSKYDHHATAMDMHWHGDIGNLYKAYRKLIDMKRSAMPHAVDVWLEGNHDIRAITDIMSKVPYVAEDFLIRLHEQLRYRNTIVLHPKQYRLVPMNLDRTYVWSHGWKHGANASSVGANYLKQLGFNRSITVGHIHRVGYYVHPKPNSYSLTAGISGSLCRKTPGYNPYEQEWDQGVIVARWNMQGGYVTQIPVVFIRDEDRYTLSANLDGKRFEVSL